MYSALFISLSLYYQIMFSTHKAQTASALTNYLFAHQSTLSMGSITTLWPLELLKPLIAWHGLQVNTIKTVTPSQFVGGNFLFPYLLTSLLKFLVKYFAFLYYLNVLSVLLNIRGHFEFIIFIVHQTYLFISPPPSSRPISLFMRDGKSIVQLYCINSLNRLEALHDISITTEPFLILPFASSCVVVPFSWLPLLSPHVFVIIGLDNCHILIPLPLRPFVTTTYSSASRQLRTNLHQRF